MHRVPLRECAYTGYLAAPEAGLVASAGTGGFFGSIPGGDIAALTVTDIEVNARSGLPLVFDDLCDGQARLYNNSIKRALVLVPPHRAAI